MRSIARYATLCALAALGAAVAARAQILDPAIETLDGILNATGSVEIGGTWAGGGTCVLIESYANEWSPDGPKRRVHDVSGAKPKGWEFGSITIVKDGSGCRVEPDPARAGVKQTLTSTCDDTHVHAEYIRDQGVRGDIYDMTLEGGKLVGTHTYFDNYHGSRQVHRCEFNKSYELKNLTPEELEQLKKWLQSEPSPAAR